MASNSPMPMWTAQDASDEDYCGSWQQLLNLHQRRIALWQPEGPSTAQAHTGCPSSMPTAPTRRPPEAPAPTGCPTSSRPTSSQCPAASVTALPTAASVTALPTAHAPPSELLYGTRAPGPDSRTFPDAQLSSILQDVALMQDLLTYQHNQLRAQEIHSRLLGGQAEHFKHSLAVCNSLLNSALNALTQAHVAYARLNEDLDLLASDFLAYKIRAQAEFLRLSATVEPLPAQLNIARRMAALPYNAHLATLRTFQVPADQWSEANPLARIRREILCLEERINRLERNLPP